MAMTDRERILAFLRSVSPRAATNNEILEATGIERHHEVYQLLWSCRSTDVYYRGSVGRFHDEH